MITVNDFKTHFYRDFPYLPEYVEGKIYFQGDEVYSSPNFYRSNIDNNTSPVSDTTAWTAYRDNVDSYLSDNDIQKAIYEALMNLNADLFEDNPNGDFVGELNLALLYLTAYYLVVDIKNSSAGLNSNAYSSWIASKSVGNVSESYGVPSWVSSNPIMSMYMTNGYGMKYLSFVLPRIAGYIHLSPGGTTV